MIALSGRLWWLQTSPVFFQLVFETIFRGKILLFSKEIGFFYIRTFKGVRNKSKTTP